jgi:hypothetical protein
MRRWLVYSLLLVFACSVALADGAETGVITGTVTDASGSALPGVQVTLEGDRAAQVAVTGEDGKFVFGLVPPGSYKLTAALEGFGSMDQAVNVSAGSRSDFELKLALATAEQITVTSEAPLVDKFNVTAGAVMQGETAGEISTSVRSFYGALQVLPGVTNDVESSDLSNSRPNVNGALWQESNVYVDGVDATFALQGGGTRVFLPTTALTEVNMEAGGGGAEYGRNVGSHTNLIVKSGTNKFHGDFNGVYSNLSWNENYDPQPVLAEDQRLINTYVDRGYTQAEAEELATNFVVYGPGENEGDEINIEASLGGPIVRDKAWFFLSRGEVSTNQRDKTLDGQIFNVSSELFASIVKLNYQPGAKHSLAYTFIDAPVDRIFLLPAMGDKYVATFYEPTGGVNSLSWNWSVNSSLFLEAKVASQVSDEDTSRPFTPEQKAQDPNYLPNPALGRWSPNNNAHSYVQNWDNTWHNGWIFDAGFGKNEFPRDQLNLAGTQFVGANNELKYGLDLQQVEWNQDVQRPDILSGGDLALGTRYGFANDCVGFTNDPVLLVNSNCFLVDYNNHGLPKGSARSEGDNYGAYIRDRITIGDHWTFNVGLRYEDQELQNDRGRTVIDAGTLSPRFSTVYDLKGDGRQLITLNAGRFFVQTAQQLVNTNLQEDWNGASNTFDLFAHIDSDFLRPFFATLPDEVACQFTGQPVGVARPDLTPYCFSLGQVRPGTLFQYVDQGLIDIDIEPYHRDEVVLGYEWQYSTNWAVDVKGIYWRVDNLIGSTNQRGPNFELFQLVENYDEYADILRNLNFVQNFVTRRGACPPPACLGLTPEAAAAQAEAILDGFSDDNRDYGAIQLQLNRRFSKGWALYNNVTFSKVEGKTYGGGNGSNDLGAFNALNDDYGRNLDAVLTEGILNGFAAPGPNYGANQVAFCSARGLGDTCVDDLRQYIGTPISTINRFGELPIDREIIYKSYGYKQWNFGSNGRQSFNLGGLFVWQSGTPWQRVGTAATPNVGTLENARNVQAIGLFFNPRGSFHDNDYYWLNITGAYGFPIKGSWSGQIRLETTNITNEQEQIVTSTTTGAPLRSRRSFQQPTKYRLIGSIRF